MSKSNEAVGNGGHGHDHQCSDNDSHTLWDPRRWRVAEQCVLFVHGERCQGTYSAIGTGSVAANKTTRAA